MKPRKKKTVLKHLQQCYTEAQVRQDWVESREIAQPKEAASTEQSILSVTNGCSKKTLGGYCLFIGSSSLTQNHAMRLGSQSKAPLEFTSSPEKTKSIRLPFPSDKSLLLPKHSSRKPYDANSFINRTYLIFWNHSSSVRIWSDFQ